MQGKKILSRKKQKPGILLVYHSGSGSTRTISEVLRDKLSDSYKVDRVKVCKDFDYSILQGRSLLIMGYPTYYFKPSISTLEYVDKLPVFKDRVQVFIFTTYGLYSGNSIRTLAGILAKKNAIVTGHIQIRGPASDGALLFPSFFKPFFRYERKANVKVDRMIEEIKRLLKSPGKISKIPQPRWYSPVSRIFYKQIQGIDYSNYKKNLKVLEDRCTNCNKCVDGCIRNCWREGKDLPSINTDSCEFCLKCVHNCPDKAIVFADRMKDSPRLDKSFYNKLKQKTFQ